MKVQQLLEGYRDDFYVDDTVPPEKEKAWSGRQKKTEGEGEEKYDFEELKYLMNKLRDKND